MGRDGRRRARASSPPGTPWRDGWHAGDATRWNVWIITWRGRGRGRRWRPRRSGTRRRRQATWGPREQEGSERGISMNRKRRHNYRGSITHETRPDGRFIQMNEGEVDDDGRQDPVRGGEQGGGGRGHRWWRGSDEGRGGRRALGIALGRAHLSAQFLEREG
jgi:hypothetical protein